MTESVLTLVIIDKCKSVVGSLCEVMMHLLFALYCGGYSDVEHNII